MAKCGFTLIELSIVLVIIGLIVGGVLVGQDLIRAAAVRAQITQIEKYNTAVNTFYGKYGYLPGDIPDPAATQFGFAPRGPGEGQGDGNGFLEGINTGAGGTPGGSKQGEGETAMFWVDLSTAGLIQGGFNTASNTVDPGDFGGTTLNLYFPQAAIGNGNYIFVLSTYGGSGWANIKGATNYYELAVITEGGTDPLTQTGLTVAQAYKIDSKIDDGLPLSGRVGVLYVNQYQWIGSENGSAGSCVGPFWNSCGNVTGTSTTCFDNGNGSAGQNVYSISQNNGAGVNCALTIQFQ